MQPNDVPVCCHSEKPTRFRSAAPARRDSSREDRRRVLAPSTFRRRLPGAAARSPFMLILLVAATASAGLAAAQDADLAVSVSGPATVNALGSITYRIVVTNNGPSTATSVAIRDDLPAGVKYVSASYGGMVSGTVSAPVETWPTVASLANGASLTRTVTMTVPVTGTLVNVCSATSTTADPTPANNDGSAAASRVTTTVIGVADLSVPSSTAEEVVALLKWCWDNRDISRYHEVFTDDFRFTFVSTDGAGNPYPDHSWTREDELTSASHLFVDGSPTQPVASEVALSLGDARFTTGFPGLASPWHKQGLVPLTLAVTRSDGSKLSASGQALFFLVRGDSAVLPQELIDRGFRPDSSRWYIERLVEVAAEDHAPVLTVPSVVSGKAGSAIMVGVTAADPDGDPITWWSAQGTPAARFTTGPEAGSATFTWTPTEADVGPHLVTFTAGNALPGSVVIAIYVLPPNQRPAASLVANPPTGPEPLVVTLDASGSIDRDGSIVAYQFDFGDRGSITQPSPVATHTYQAGT